MENTQIQQEYHGKKIFFDEKKEEWYINTDGKYQYHKSLQIIKNWIDKSNKKQFERIPVFVSKNRYHYGSREQGYENGVITSVGVDGTVFVVREGRKSAEHCYAAYIKDENNASLIKEIAIAHKEKVEAEAKYDMATKKLKEVDFDKLREKVLGKIK